LLKAISRILQDERADRMLQAIGETINEDAVTTLQKGALAVRNTRIYALRAEKRLLCVRLLSPISFALVANELTCGMRRIRLDVARETYKENLNDAFELCEDMKAKHGIEMGLQYSGGTFVFSVPKTELEDKELPRVFTNVVSGRAVKVLGDTDEMRRTRRVRRSSSARWTSRRRMRGSWRASKRSSS
jgi:DNA mismatch repair protein MSH4